MGAFDAICDYVTETMRGGHSHGGSSRKQTGYTNTNLSEVTQRELDGALWRTARSVSRDGASYALKCRCHGVTLGFPCHSRSIRRTLILRERKL